MTPRQRFLAAIARQIPDRVPATPDISNYIPAKRTGLPFWDIYFNGKIPRGRAYLDAADYFGIDAWIGCCFGASLLFGDARYERHARDEYRPDLDAMVRTVTYQTSDGPLDAQQTCFRADPPSPTVRPIKDIARDAKRYRWLQRVPTGIDDTAWHVGRDECLRRNQAFGVAVGYPGFHNWISLFEGGLEACFCAAADDPALFDRWYDVEFEMGSRVIELVLARRPDYILFGGSGTLTLSSPNYVQRYCIPALAAWSKLARQAGVLTMLHSCGKSRALVKMLAEKTEVDLINPLEMPPMGDVDLAEVKGAHGRHIALMGNLHTTRLMLHGSPADVTAASIAAMRDAGHAGGFILSTGDQCPRDTPDDNLFAVVEAAKTYGLYDPATGSLPHLPATSPAPPAPSAP